MSTCFLQSGSCLAYVAQYAFHHREQYLDETPVQYIQGLVADGGEGARTYKKHIEDLGTNKAKTFKYESELMYLPIEARRALWWVVVWVALLRALRGSR